MKAIIGTEAPFGKNMTGLNCSSMEVFKCLEGLEDLNTLFATQHPEVIGNNNIIVDFRNTGLKTANINRYKSKYLFSRLYRTHISGYTEEYPLLLKVQIL